VRAYRPQVNRAPVYRAPVNNYRAPVNNLIDRARAVTGVANPQVYRDAYGRAFVYDAARRVRYL
jgi:hypothetical protein